MLYPEIEDYWQKKINLYGSNYIQVNGSLLWIDRLDINEYPIEMIAHSLANKCRFGGHTLKFYSIAQHCVIGARQFKDKLKRKTFLLHDSSEVILDDLVRPIKKLLPDYSRLESQVENSIKTYFNVDWNQDYIKNIDTRMLVTEARQLLDPIYPWWNNYNFEPLDIKLTPWSPVVAKKRFLKEWYDCIS